MNTANADRARQVYEIRSDLRDALPFGLLPPHRSYFIRWLHSSGVAEYGLTTEELQSFEVWLEQDPTCGIETTYRFFPPWQRAIPHGLSRDGWPRLLEHVRQNKDLTGPWLKQVKPPSHVEIGEANGINLLGHFRVPCGVGEEINRFAEGLNAIRVPNTCRDVPLFQMAKPFPGPRPHGLEVHPVTLLKFGAAVDLQELYTRTGVWPRADVYRVAGWSWELDQFPLIAVKQLPFVDEIWTPSEFVAKGARAIANGRPVRVMTPAIPTPTPAANPRARFHLDADAFVVLFMFDIGSIYERKNPLALIRSFRKAFQGETRPLLVLKISNTAFHPTAMAEIQSALQGIRSLVISDTLSRSDIDTLLATCDCYASLHRSEGFGMSLAEAMLLGKPTIATNYSGNLDFMNVDNSYLVNCTMTKVDRDIGPYPAGSTWAEPDEDHAADLLRQVFYGPDEAQAKAQKGQRELTELLSPRNAGLRIQRRLVELEQERLR